MTDAPRKRLPVRWLTLGETVAVCAVVIAALGYWDSRREREAEAGQRAEAARERQAERKAAAVKARFLMSGSVERDGEVIRMRSVREDQVVQTQTLWFPQSVHGGAISTTGNPRLEADWLSSKALKGEDDAKTGRVPVGVLTVYIEDGETRTDRALYQVGYRLHTRALRSDKVELEGLSLARRDVKEDLQTAAGALWAAR